MKREYVRTVFVFEDHFKKFKKTLDKAAALMKKYFRIKNETKDESRQR